MKLDSKLAAQLGAMVADEGLHFVATEVVGSGPGTVLRLIVDDPTGVNLDRCAAVSRQASALLDVEDPIGHAYTLEVTSPGLDRKLYNRDDYLRFAGREVKVRMRPSFREHRTVTGELLGVDGDLVRVRSDSGDVVELPLPEVFETRLHIDWKSILKEGKSRP